MNKIMILEDDRALSGTEQRLLRLLVENRGSHLTRAFLLW